jgi:hypothetical protein
MISSANCIWILPRKGVLVPRTGALDPGASPTSTSSPETIDEDEVEEKESKIKTEK